jgi:hypothetical protein
MRRLALVIGLLVALGAVGAAAFFALDPGDVPEITETNPERTDEGDEEPVEPGMVRIAGAVEDEGGEPVVGAAVYLLAKGDPMPPVVGPLHQRTDSEGRFALLREEELTSDLIATCPGFRPTLVEHVAGGTGIRVVMKRGGEIRGVITDDRDRPVIGASVFARSSGSEIAPPAGIYLPHHETLDATYARALSGLGGKFVIKGVGEGKIDVRAEKRTHPELLRPVLGVKAGDANVKLVLLHRFVASVFVVDAHGNAPIISAWVKIELPEKKALEGRTDRRGEMRATLDFPAARAPDERVTVSAGTEEYGNIVEEDVPLARLADGAEFKLILVKKDPAVLHVKLTYDTGKPFNGWVYFEVEPEVGKKFNRWSRRRKDGMSTIKMPPGRYTVIRARGQSVLMGGEIRNIALAPGEELTQTLTIVRGGDLRINVTGGKDKEIRGARVKVTHAGGTNERTVWGRQIRMTDLPPGIVTIDVTHEGFQPQTKNVTLKKDGSETISINLEKKVKPK